MYIEISALPCHIWMLYVFRKTFWNVFYDGPFFLIISLITNRVVLGGGKSQIVRAPLREFWVSVGKPDWIVFSLKSPIGGRAKFLNKKYYL